MTLAGGGASWCALAAVAGEGGYTSRPDRAGPPSTAETPRLTDGGDSESLGLGEDPLRASAPGPAAAMARYC